MAGGLKTSIVISKKKHMETHNYMPNTNNVVITTIALFPTVD